MKSYNRIIGFIIVGMIVMLCGMNLVLLKIDHSEVNKEYRISMNRIEKELVRFEDMFHRAPDSLWELKKFAGEAQYPAILSLEHRKVDQDIDAWIQEWVDDPNQEYVLYVTNQNYYKITYVIKAANSHNMLLWMNLYGFGLLIVFGIIAVYLKITLLRPFKQVTELPYELSKGNLTIPVKEEKNRFFGRFLWGMNLLREMLEENKVKELQLQKDKKLLLLSLSHDIKTPLSAIKLYAKALSKNLYKSEEKKIEITESISDKVDEIESYISEIVKASNEDFLQFEVENKEFYIGSVLSSIKEYYEEKMMLNHIEFELLEYPNCLVFGDADRLTQVIQNIMENAIKYGDGRRIWIETEREEEEYAILIKNTGCTLPGRELPHVFDSFFRGSNVEKRPGSGLGLYICRKLMHLMEGEVIASMNDKKEGDDMVITVVLRMAR